jgi:hypothetical protein
MIGRKKETAGVIRICHITQPGFNPNLSTAIRGYKKQRKLHCTIPVSQDEAEGYVYIYISKRPLPLRKGM